MSPNATHSDLLPPGSFDDRGPALRSFVIVLCVISIVAIALRFWSRMLTGTGGKRTPKLWWDDWLAMLALPLLLAAGALILDMIRLGLGRHIWTVAPENVLPILKRLFAVYYCYNAGLTVAKASCLLFYTRIFSAPRTSTWLSRAIWITHALNFGVWMGSVLLVSFNYNPKSQTSTGYRPSTVAMWLSSAVPGVLIDLVLLILPLPMIWKLRINRGRKIAVLGVFVCGYCVIVVSLGRLITITKGKDMDQDLLYIGIPSIYWQAAEGPMTLLCICLPSTLNLWRSVTSVAKSKFSSHTSGSNGHTPDSPERTNTKARTKNSVPSTFDTELSNFAVGDNNSGDGSESMILIPQDTHHSYVTNIQKPPNVLVLKTEPLDPNIHVQNDFYVSRNSAKNWR